MSWRQNFSVESEITASTTWSISLLKSFSHTISPNTNGRILASRDSVLRYRSGRILFWMHKASLWATSRYRMIDYNVWLLNLMIRLLITIIHSLLLLIPALVLYIPLIWLHTHVIFPTSHWSTFASISVQSSTFFQGLVTQTQLETQVQLLHHPHLRYQCLVKHPLSPCQVHLHVQHLSYHLLQCHHGHIYIHYCHCHHPLILPLNMFIHA